MRIVDCEWLLDEGHGCCHKELAKGWRIGIFRPKCIEYSFDHVDCKYRESLWDMLKKEKKSNQPGPVPNQPPPPTSATKTDYICI